MKVGSVKHSTDTSAFTPWQLLQLAVLYENLDNPDKTKATWQKLFNAPWDAPVTTAVTEACSHLLQSRQDELGRDLVHDKGCGALCELQVVMR